MPSPRTWYSAPSLQRHPLGGGLLGVLRCCNGGSCRLGRIHRRCWGSRCLDIGQTLGPIQVIVVLVWQSGGKRGDWAAVRKPSRPMTSSASLSSGCSARASQINNPYYGLGHLLSLRSVSQILREPRRVAFRPITFIRGTYVLLARVKDRTTIRYLRVLINPVVSRSKFSGTCSVIKREPAWFEV